MRDCELCKRRASVFCESDQAILCWDCDAQVHAANFLVAKHTRCLLCQVCHSATPWKGSGSKLCPTVSVCEACFENYGKKEENFGEEEEGHHVGGSDEEDEQDIDDDYDDDEDDEGEDDEEEDGENQVVPWSCPYSPPPPPPPSASTSSSDGENASTLKRIYRSGDFDSDDDVGSSSGLNQEYDDEDGDSSLQRPWKRVRSGEDDDNIYEHREKEDKIVRRETRLIGSIRKLQKKEIGGADDASAAISEICKLSRDPGRSF